MQRISRDSNSAEHLPARPSPLHCQRAQQQLDRRTGGAPHSEHVVRSGTTNYRTRHQPPGSRTRTSCAGHRPPLVMPPVGLRRLADLRPAPSPVTRAANALAGAQTRRSTSAIAVVPVERTVQVGALVAVRTEVSRCSWSVRGSLHRLSSADDRVANSSSPSSTTHGCTAYARHSGAGGMLASVSRGPFAPSHRRPGQSRWRASRRGTVGRARVRRQSASLVQHRSPVRVAVWLGRGFRPALR